MFSTEVPSVSHKLVWGLLAAFIVAHIVFASLLSSNTPYRASGIVRSSRSPKVEKDIGAPDERQHANYVARLLRGEGYPVFSPNDPDLYENYQGHQPPAFYTLAAGWAKALGVTEVESRESGTKLRALNAVLGGLGVMGAFFLGTWGFKRSDVGLVAAAFVALLPMNCALSGAINNDVLLIVLSTWTLAVLGLAVNEGWTLRRAAALGTLVGLALLTKTTAVSLLPIVLLAMWLRRPTLMIGGTAWGLILILAGGWWMRNQSLYGDPLAMKVFNEAFGGSPKAQTLIDVFGPFFYWVNMVGWWSARSFFGAFGYMDIFLNETGLPAGSAPNALYRLLLAASFVCFLGWIGSSSKGIAKGVPKVQILNGVFTLIVVLLFIRFNMQYFQAQARYVLPALGPIACGFALGILQLAKERWAIALAAVVIILGGTSTYAVSRLPAEFELRTVGS